MGCFICRKIFWRRWTGPRWRLAWKRELPFLIPKSSSSPGRCLCDSKSARVKESGCFGSCSIATCPGNWWIAPKPASRCPLLVGCVADCGTGWNRLWIKRASQTAGCSTAATSDTSGVKFWTDTTTVHTWSGASWSSKAGWRNKAPAVDSVTRPDLVSTVVHSIHFPVSARNFVMPMVECLIRHGIDAELWFEDQDKHQAVIRQITVPSRHVDSDLSFDPLVFNRRLAAYRRELRKSPPGILRSHQARASLIPLLAGYLEKVPARVYHNHGLAYLGYRSLMRRLLRTLEQINIRLATHVLLVSHSNLAVARSDGLLRAGKGTVLANGSAVGIDLQEFSEERFNKVAQKAARQKFDLPADRFGLAYVGRPVKRKGFHFLLKAWKSTGLGLKGNVLLVAGCTQEECAGALGHAVEGVKGLGYLT